MMKVSSKSTYAIRALIQLGQQSKDGPVRLAKIAERQRIPLQYLEQIFSKLRRAGLVTSIRGPRGGYRLAKNPSDITLHDVITVLEGPMEPVLCTMPENRTPDCHEVEGCMSRLFCNELDGELSRILIRNNLGTMIGQAEKVHTQ